MKASAPPKADTGRLLRKKNEKRRKNINEKPKKKPTCQNLSSKKNLLDFLSI